MSSGMRTFGQLLRTVFSTRRPRPIRRKPAGARLMVEALEDRMVPATFNVVGSDLQIALETNETVGVLTNGANYSFTLESGTWSGTNGSVATGTGTATLTAAAASFATLQLSGGKLVTASGHNILNPIVVGAGATLSGTGTTAAVTVQSAGSVAPGTSPGILNTANLAVAGSAASALTVSSYTTEAAGSGATVNADTGGVELTNGLLVTDPNFGFGDPAYVNYRDDGADDGLGQPKVLFDLGSTFALSTVSIRYLHSTTQAGGTITSPEQALVSVSTDGITFTTPVAFTSQFNSSAGNAIRTAVLDLTGMTGRFVRVDIRQSQQHTFIDEISFTGSPPGAFFVAEVNAATPGSGHDQLNVTGTVSIGGATLTPSGTITSSPGQEVVLINNDGTDAVTGTFNGLAENATVTINGVNFFITYQGGTGNDVALIQGDTRLTLDASGNLVITDVGTTSNDNLTIKSDTTNNRFVISDVSGALITAIAGATGSGTGTVLVPFAAVTGSQITVTTLGGNDSLTVDLGLGNFSKSISYNGGTQTTSDSLTVTGGGTFATVTHGLTSASSGTIDVTGKSQISYAGLEPVTDALSATDRVFYFNGGAETILVTDAAGANMTIDSTLSEAITFANPTGSLTINAGTGNDTITLTSVDAGFNASLTINGGTGDDTVNLNGDITFAANKNLDVNLQNDDLTPGTDSINVGANANLILSGTGAATLSASKNIAMASGSSVVTVNGNLVLSANQQAAATAGTFRGIDLNSAVVEVTGTGVLTVAGRSGNSGASQYGVDVRNAGALLRGGATGTMTVTGKSIVTSGNENYAVMVEGGGLLSSNGANVEVTGTADGPASGPTGVRVTGTGSIISAGGMGSLTVRGTATGANNFAGVYAVFSGFFTSDGGDVLLEGSGRTAGVFTEAGGRMNSGGTGKLTIQGTGTTSRGVRLDNVTAGGDLAITGQAPAAVDGIEIVGPVASTNGTITLKSDRMNLSGNLTAGAGKTASLVSFTAARPINLGAADSTTILGLTDAELDRISAATIQIGDANSGVITVSADISRAASTIVNLTSGGAINFTTGQLNTAGGNSTLTPGSSASVGGAKTATDLTVGTLAFASNADLSIVIGGATVDAQFQQLNVAGTVNLIGVDLVLSGSFTPSAGNVFTIVSATSVTGTFNNLANNASLPFNGRRMKINYTPTTVTLTDEPNTPPVVASDNAAVTADEGQQATASGTFSDAQGNATVTITASAGTVTQDNTAGTWSWSFDTTDGPDESQTVTITATDNANTITTTTFDLTVNNAIPTVTADNANATVVLGATATNTGTFGDAGDDTVTITASLGNITQNDVDHTWSWSYVPGLGESQTVTITATDSDTVFSTTTFDLVVHGFDFGDAPDSYHTTFAAGGARHAATGPFLGATRDEELDGTPSAAADGDGSDEDGVAFTAALVQGQSVTLDVTASGAAVLDAWIDFNGDGDFADTGEQVFSSRALTPGVNALSFVVPTGAVAGTTFARFRVSTAGGLSFDGAASDGEIEDYQVAIDDALILTGAATFPCRRTCSSTPFPMV